MKKHAYQCSICYGENIFWDANAVWDVDSQQFKLGPYIADPFCEDCSQIVEVTEVELEEANES